MAKYKTRPILLGDLHVARNGKTAMWRTSPNSWLHMVILAEDEKPKEGQKVKL
jgi:hypothetical protein